jgi:pimeloyl-ACP methyl ester carboxylesterase
MKRGHHFLLSINLLLVGVPSLARADDDLTRRGWLGVSLQANANGEVELGGVFPGGSAEAAGLKQGDMIRALDGKAVGGVPDLLKALRGRRAGQSFKLEVVPDGEPRTITVTLKEWPREADTPAYRVEYGSVKAKSGRLRTITYVPKAIPAGARAPAWLILQGLSAVTLDNLRPDEPIEAPTGMGLYRTMGASLASAGCVVMRVDKAGCGDSEGDASLLDFDNELDGFRAALAGLKARPDVDPERVLLFGHSMGGVFAPILAGESPVRGVAVYGTVFKSWLEYLLENHRRQEVLAGTELAEIDRGIKRMEVFFHEHLVRKQAPRDVLRDHPDLAAPARDLGVDGDLVFTRHYTFFQQLYDVNLAEAWGKVGGAQVLALWGAAEMVSGADDHEAIAALVNQKRPGSGRFAIVPESGHGFERAASARDILAASNAGGNGLPFNPAILGILTTWTAEISGRAP